MERPLYHPLRLVPPPETSWAKAELNDICEMFKDRDEAELIGHIQRMSLSDLKRYAIPACNRMLKRRMNPSGRARLMRIVAAVRTAMEEQTP